VDGISKKCIQNLSSEIPWRPTVAIVEMCNDFPEIIGLCVGRTVPENVYVLGMYFSD